MLGTNHGVTVRASDAGWAAPQLFRQASLLLVLRVIQTRNVPAVLALRASEHTYTFFHVVALLAGLRSLLVLMADIEAVLGHDS